MLGILTAAIILDDPDYQNYLEVRVDVFASGCNKNLPPGHYRLTQRVKNCKTRYGVPAEAVTIVKGYGCKVAKFDSMFCGPGDP